MHIDSAIIAAVITGSLTLIGTILVTMVSHNSNRTLMEYQIKEIKSDIIELSERVNKHNNLVERMTVVEQSTKSAHKRLDDLKGEH